MEIREIDGKKFVEYDEARRQTRRTLLSVAFIVAIIIASYAMIVTTKTLIENKEIITSDPLIFGMDVHGFVSCQCFDEQGSEWSSQGTGFINRPRGINNFPIINITKFEVINGTSRSN